MGPKPALSTKRFLWLTNCCPQVKKGVIELQYVIDRDLPVGTSPEPLRPVGAFGEVVKPPEPLQDANHVIVHNYRLFRMWDLSSIAGEDRVGVERLNARKATSRSRSLAAGVITYERR